MTSRGIIIPLLICVLNRIHSTFKMKVVFYLIHWLAFETCPQLDLLCSVLIALKSTILIRDLKVILEYSWRFFTGIRTIAWLWRCQLSKHNSMCTMHYNDVIMTTMASQIISPTVVYSIVYSGADQRKHQSSASLAFVRGIHRDQWIPRTKGQ